MHHVAIHRRQIILRAKLIHAPDDPGPDAGEGLGDGIQKNQQTFGKDVIIVFAGRTSMQAGGMRAGRIVRRIDRS